MKNFTAEEIKEVLRIAKALAPQFTEEQYNRLMELGSRLVEPDFLESAWGLNRLEEERSITCSQSLDEYKQLLEDKEEADSELSQARSERESEERILAAKKIGRQQLEKEMENLKRELELFKKKTEEEKRLMAKDLEQARRNHKVNKEEIEAAGDLKAVVESHGLSLKPTLKLLAEYKGDAEVLQRLVEAANEYDSATKARTALQAENAALKKENEVKRQETSREEEKLVKLKEGCQETEASLKRWKSDENWEKYLRRLYHRYLGWTGLLEYLSVWNGVYLVRCRLPMCGARFWVDRLPTNFRAKHVCPCCGVGNITENVIYDDEAFKALNISHRGPIKVTLGVIENG